MASYGGQLSGARKEPLSVLLFVYLSLFTLSSRDRFLIESETMLAASKSVILSPLPPHLQCWVYLRVQLHHLCMWIMRTWTQILLCAQQALFNSLSPCPNSQGQTLREVSTFLWVSVSCEPSDAQSRARLVGQKGPFRPGTQEHLCSLSCAWDKSLFVGMRFHHEARVSLLESFL